MTVGNAAELIEDETALTLHASSDEYEKQRSSRRNISLADTILGEARQRRIQLRPDPLLIETLAHHNVVDSIPPELFSTVAEIMKFIERLESAHETR
jgi:type III secretion system FlhB-like substrate exporter